MARKRCNTCLGIYDDVLPDGLRYFHVCPPVAEYFDSTKAPIDRATADSIAKLGGRYYVRYVERPNARDENAIKGRDMSTRGQPKKAGTGTTEIPPPAPADLVDAELIVVAPPPIV